MKNKKRWLIQAPIGIILTSAGLCMVIEAGIWKFNGASPLEWIAAGTGALIVFNAGLCVMIDSLRFRWRHEAAEES